VNFLPFLSFKNEINNKKNNLKAQLTDLGFKQERHKSLIKIPIEVLIL
jgi:hypothetical protein